MVAELTGSIEGEFRVLALTNDLELGRRRVGRCVVIAARNRESIRLMSDAASLV